MIFDTRLWEKAGCSKSDKKKILPSIELILRLSQKARREGLLSVEDDVPSVEPLFLKNGLRLVIDGCDPEEVRELLLAGIHAGRFSGKELLLRMIAANGVLGIQEGISPNLLRRKLYACLGEEFEPDAESDSTPSSAVIENEDSGADFAIDSPSAVSGAETSGPVYDDACRARLHEIFLANRRIVSDAPVTAEEVRSLAGAVNSSAAGARTLVDILRSQPGPLSSLIKDAVKEHDSALYAKLAEAWIVFEDLATLDNMAIQRILRETDSADLVIALKGASSAVQRKIFSNLSKRAAGMLKEDLEYVGPIRLEDVLQAQKRIVDVAGRLELSGDIVIFRQEELLV